MALQISFTDPNTGYIYTNAYLAIDSVAIKKVPSGEIAAIRCAIFASQAARQANKKPLPFQLTINCKGAKYNTFFKTPPDNATLDINKIVLRASYKFIKTLDPVGVAGDKDYFEGLNIDIKNTATDIDNV